MKTLKKLFSVSAIVALLGTLAPMYAFGANYSDELNEAYAYAYKNEITTMKTIDAADMYGSLTRVAMAKMIANYATKVLGLTPDTSAKCEFTDVTAALDAQYDNGVTNACQLGLMGQNITAFRPNDLVTRAEFGTTLSRALNANSDDLATMNAANPYYKDHLNFLKAEGIMTKIDNPSMTEVRGYVMLMMMRADENYTPAEGCTAEELLKCVTADDYDACIAKCSGGENPDPIVVKAGTLNVSAKANDGAKVVLDGDSELDTISLKASETINVEKITLERYGYTKNEGINVWLENTDGVVISNDKDLTKDEVTLTIKKDYRNATETKEYVIVAKVTSKDGETVLHTAGETLGFKVKDVTSSAETLKIASYTPTEYTMAVYEGTNVKVTAKGKDTTYNYKEGEYYQVAKLRVAASNSAVSVKGFTLKAGEEIEDDASTDDIDESRQANDIDLSKHIAKIEVLGDDGTSLKLSTADLKKGSIKLAFPAQTIEAKKNADFTVRVTLKDFEDYGEAIVLDIDAIDATEVKTSTRVSMSEDSSVNGYVYTFEGSKIKVTNTNLGTVNAVAGSEDVVVAEGQIEVGEAVAFNDFDITFTEGIDTLELWLNGSVVEEGKTTDHLTFTFKGVVIDKSGKLQFVADIDEDLDETATPSIETTAVFNKILLANGGNNIGKYDDSDVNINKDNFVGSINFSTIKMQAAKGALENTLTKKVEVIADGSSVRKTIFDGTYTAKKGDVYLNELNITPSAALKGDDYVTLYVSVDGEEVATVEVTAEDATTAINETFGDVLVKDGKSVSVKVEADVMAVIAANEENYTVAYTLELVGEDEDGKVSGRADDDCVTISLVKEGTVTVEAKNKDDVLIQTDGTTSLAKFTVKSSLEGTKLSSFVMNGFDDLSADEFKVTVDGTTYDSDDDEFEYNAGTLTISDLTVDVDDGVVVEISYKALIPVGTYEIALAEINGSSATKSFNKLVVPALVKVTKQENLGDSTKYTFSIDKYDSSYEVSELVLVAFDGTNYIEYPIGSISDGETEEVANGTTMNFITAVCYDVDDDTNFDDCIEKEYFKDYFRVGSEFLKVFKAKDN